jgi:hypothetical protein
LEVDNSETLDILDKDVRDISWSNWWPAEEVIALEKLRILDVGRLRAVTSIVTESQREDLLETFISWNWDRITVKNSFRGCAVNINLDEASIARNREWR